MADLTRARRLASTMLFLRSGLMLIAGLYALLFPQVVLTVLVLLGGAMLLVDGLLGLWGVTFGGQRTGNVWFDVVRNVFSILTGGLILISPLVATLVTAVFLVYLVAFQAIFVGVMEIFVVVRERQHYARIWPVVLNGLVYLLFGLLLLLSPLTSAAVLVMIGGVMMVVFAVGLFGLAWRMRKGREAAAIQRPS